MTTRNYHLRERRLKLGASQELVGCVAGWTPSGAQPTVSAVERGITTNPATIRKIREAIVYLELEPRRRREWEREEAKQAEIIEAAIMLQRRDVLFNRLVDLLFDGRGEDFDALGERLDLKLVEEARDAYLDECFPAQTAAA